MLAANYEIYTEGGLGFVVAYIYVHEESGSNLSEYQIMVNLDESNFDYWQAEPRIKIYQGGTLCSYWVEFWNPSDKQARIWVKVPNILANSTVHLVILTSFYSTSDGEATFDFFDDFSGDLGKWSTPPSGVVIEDGALKIPAASDHPAHLNTLYSTYTVNPQNHAIEMRTKISGATGGSTVFLVGFRGDGDTAYLSRHSYSTTRTWDISVGSVDGATQYGDVYGYDNVYAQDTWHRFSFKNYGTTLKLTDVATPANELSSTNDFFDNITSANIGFSRWDTPGTFYVDFIFVRKYVFPEPTVFVVPA